MSTSCQRYESVVYELKTSAVVWGASGYGNPVAGPVADMLIGMDVISMGDFKLINDGKTSFSIRTPSEGDAPFVADTQEAAQ